MKIKLPNVRLSFPTLFEARKAENADAKTKPKFEATFILDKKAHAKTIKEIQAGIASFNGHAKLKGKKPSVVCLRSGDDTPARVEMEGYGPGVMTLVARSVRRPRVVDRNREDLTVADDKPYAGCYVNALVELYPNYHPAKGGMVSATLLAVQFVKDGEPFGAGPVDANEEFNDISGTDDSDNPLE